MADIFDLRPERLKIIWGAKAIALKVNCSADFVRDRLVNVPESSVRKCGGRYCANEADLIAYFRGGQPAPIHPNLPQSLPLGEAVRNVDHDAVKQQPMQEGGS